MLTYARFEPHTTRGSILAHERLAAEHGLSPELAALGIQHALSYLLGEGDDFDGDPHPWQPQCWRWTSH